MPLTVVVGGQYGSEGKGKIVSYLASTARGDISVVRCGGSNAGHTAVGYGKKYSLRQLPSGVVSDRCKLYLAAGMLLDLPVLLSEIRKCGVDPQRLRIDRNAAVIGREDVKHESNAGLRQRLGSTLSGTGSATARKVLRDPSLRLAVDVPELADYVDNVSSALNTTLDRGEDVVVEGTQGFGLSLHHTDHYPYVTSRDTTAAEFLSECGLSPRLVTDLILVLRTYPIRVAGNSGPLTVEISWDEIRSRAGYPHPLAEYTTVTRDLRRVGEFDWRLAEQAVRINRPTSIALHGADYLDYGDYGKSKWSDLGDTSKQFVSMLEARFGIPVTYVSTGPAEGDFIDRRQLDASTLTELGSERELV